MAGLTHYKKKSGEVAMVDVTAKAVTNRIAVARGFLRVSRPALAKVRRLQMPKGHPLEVARIAGIAAAKRTSEWIPLCHPLPLTHIDVAARVCQNGLEFTSRVTASARTGVEMEALTAVAAAALTAYDMLKALDKGMEITSIYLVEKHGGRSGDYIAPSARARAPRRKLAHSRGHRGKK
ncbi:MAG TPA: cyclic pyranopterin monophosphate synthase MoaC [Methylomirabilota bacterium]|nr:cyclic pyranopterin monophosphate synthase MoaC [Methylomirabilota bacterium]